MYMEGIVWSQVEVVIGTSCGQNLKSTIWNVDIQRILDFWNIKKSNEEI